MCAGTDTVPDSALDMAVQPRPRQPWQDARARMLHEHQGQDAAWEQDPMGFSPGCCTRSRQPGQLLMGNRSKALQSAAQTDMEAGKPPLESGQGAARGSQPSRKKIGSFSRDMCNTLYSLRVLNS